MKDIKSILHYDYKFSFIMSALISLLIFGVLLGAFYVQLNNYMLESKIPIFGRLFLQIIIGVLVYLTLFKIICLITCAKTKKFFQEAHKIEESTKFNKFLKDKKMKIEDDFLKMFTPWFSMEFERMPFLVDSQEKFKLIFSEFFKALGCIKCEVVKIITQSQKDTDHVLAYIIKFSDSAIVLRVRDNKKVFYVEAFWFNEKTLEDSKRRDFIGVLKEKLLVELSPFGCGLTFNLNPGWANMSYPLSNLKGLNECYLDIIGN